jgi:Family of unknown function (DUF6286)
MRLLNRPLALILAVALAGASILVIIEVIAVAVHASPVVVHWPAWYRWAGRTRWNAQVVRVWAAILIVVGLLILTIELKPRRITRLRLRNADDATDAGLTRSGLARTLRTAATGIDGITGAAVTVRRRRARVAAMSAARGRAAAGALKQPVSQAVRGRLDALELYRPPRLKVRVTSRSR